MRSLHTLGYVLLASVAVTAAGFLALQQPVAGAAVGGPAYSAAQATRGRASFEARCSVCHGLKLEGGVGPALAGEALAARRRSLGALFGFMTTNMPLGAPGSLDRNEYVAIMAYLLAKNGHPAGRAALTFDAAKRSTERM